MKKRLLLASIVTTLALSPITASADYYQYVDELRKPGQTVAEAKAQQEKSYKEQMTKKYESVRKQAEKRRERREQRHTWDDSEEDRIRAHHRKLERAEAKQRLGLTDAQQSKLEAIHNQQREFAKAKMREIKEFQKAKKQEFRDSLSKKQRSKLDKMKGAHREKVRTKKSERKERPSR